MQKAFTRNLYRYKHLGIPRPMQWLIRGRMPAPFGHLVIRPGLTVAIDFRSNGAPCIYDTIFASQGC